MSSNTLNQIFFDDLWPYILKENICDTLSTNTSKFFIPKQQLDKLWAHDLLAKKCYKRYQKPKELKMTYPEDELQPSTSDTSFRERCVVIRPPHFTTIAEICHTMHVAQERSQKLAYNYVNRKFPWYMTPPIYDAPLEITDELRAEFSNPFEMNILKSMHLYKCKLLVIDVASEMCLGEMERWAKFCKYAQIVAVVRCEIMARHLELLDTFKIVWLAENLENTWQEELGRSLYSVAGFARNLGIFKNCAQSFLYIFSNMRYGSSWDTYKVLRKY